MSAIVRNMASTLVRLDTYMGVVSAAKGWGVGVARLATTAQMW